MYIVLYIRKQIHNLDNYNNYIYVSFNLKFASSYTYVELEEVKVMR